MTLFWLFPGCNWIPYYSLTRELFISEAEPWSLNIFPWFHSTVNMIMRTKQPPHPQEIWLPASVGKKTTLTEEEKKTTYFICFLKKLLNESWCRVVKRQISRDGFKDTESWLDYIGKSPIYSCLFSTSDTWKKSVYCCADVSKSYQWKRLVFYNNIEYSGPSVPKEKNI